MKNLELQISPLAMQIVNSCSRPGACPRLPPSEASRIRDLRADKNRWTRKWALLQGRAHSHLSLCPLASFLPTRSFPSPSSITHRSNWTTFPTPGWQYACSESGYTDSKISLEWFKRVFDPQTKERANQRPRVLICDGFGTHETLEILEYCFENNIILCRLPSHKLQPCDIAVFAPLKSAYRERVE
jgi:DDE superfamily endonuclease